MIEMTCSTPDFIENACSGLLCDQTDWDTVIATARHVRDTSLFTRSVFLEKIESGWTLPEGAANTVLLEDAVKAVGEIGSVVEEYSDGGPMLESWPESSSTVLEAAKRAHCAEIYLSKLDAMMIPPDGSKDQDDQDPEPTDTGEAGASSSGGAGLFFGGVFVVGLAAFGVAAARKKRRRR